MYLLRNPFENTVLKRQTWSILKAIYRAISSHHNEHMLENTHELLHKARRVLPTN